MKRTIKDIHKSLSQRDKDALKSIYQFRCLTQKQLYQLHYSKSLVTNEPISEDTSKRKIKELLAFSLIEEVERLGIARPKGEDVVYFLTSLGIDLVRHCFDLPTNIYDVKKQVVKRGYFRASELKIYPKNINHQIHQNQFVIDFMKLDLDIKWKYFDEKYVSQFTGIRPDGMLTMLDTDFFIEMDMATESKKQLLEKWENYRNFLNSREYAYKERKIVVLFVCEGTERIEARKNIVKHTIFERLIDVMDSDFEIYVGSREELLHLMTDKLVPLLQGEFTHQLTIRNELKTNHQLHVSSGSILKELFNGTEYGFYLRKLNQDNHIVFEHNKVQEFLLDDYSHSPVSVLSKIAYLDKNNVYFKDKFNREISYIVVVENEELIHKDLKLVDLIGIKNVYYTTKERLNTLPFHEALFQFDFLGNIHSFNNNGLEERVFERMILNET